MDPQDLQNYITLEKARECLRILQQELENGSGKAGYLLSLIYSEDNTFVPEDIRAAIGVSNQTSAGYCIKSFDLLKAKATDGDGESMHLVATYYHLGLPPVNQDMSLFKEWTDKAAAAGFVVMEDLMAIYGNPQSPFYDRDQALKFRKQL